MLKDCRPGGRFEGPVLITEWKESPFRQKQGSYIHLTCQDATASFFAKIWEPAEEHCAWLKQYDIYLITAAVSEYRGNLELSIESLQPLPEQEIDLLFLLPSSPYSPEQLEERLNLFRQKISDQDLKALVNRILDHPKVGKRYRTAPAAKKIHQAYLRGLWEHSLAVAGIAESIAHLYPEVNLDLVLTGALLHDIGKIFEYEYERSIAYTTEGRLLGHIMMGAEFLSREMALMPDFDADLRIRLLHVLTSHHGRYEWQSPKRPKSMEAVIIHYADSFK